MLNYRRVLGGSAKFIFMGCDDGMIFVFFLVIKIASGVFKLTSGDPKIDVLRGRSYALNIDNCSHHPQLEISVTIIAMYPLVN